jgi:chromosomal replication initiator protein
MIGRRDNPLIVVYMSSEEFTNELINAIRNKSTQKFRGKYRQVDALLIDDIQFIAGKESTQEEFFHTFNTLYDARKQIVISSDKPPKEIPSLQERLVSRFEWGLVADLQPPDTETRIAILQKKSEDLGMEIPGQVIHYIASLATSNIRELEGALIRVRAYSSLTREPVTIELVQESLRELVGRAALKQVTPDLIQKVVAEHYDLRIADLKSRNKQRAVAFPRQIAMFLCKDMIPTISLAEIGDAFGGKDHSTVHHACKKVADEIRTDLPLRRTVEHLQALARE